MKEISVLNMGMVNVYLLHGKRNILIDTGAKGMYQKILNKLIELDVDPKTIDLIVLTHGHNDHYGNINELAELTGAKVLIHKNDLKNLTDGNNGDLIPNGRVAGLMIKVVSKFDKPEKRITYNPDIVIDGEYDLNEFGFHGKIIPTPGHSKGSISILTDTGKAMIGDSLMAMMPWSKPKYPFLYDDLSMIRKSMNMLIDKGAKHFYLSHGRDYGVEMIKNTINK